MLDDEEYGSDTSDDDYVPNDGEVFSDEEGSGVEEDFVADDNTVVTGKRKRNNKKVLDDSIRKRKGGIKLEGVEVSQEKEEDTYSKELAEQIKKEKEEKKKEEEKKKSDSLWADFMKDVGGPKAKPKPTPTGGLASLSQVCTPKTNRPSVVMASASKDNTENTAIKQNDTGSKITITKEYDFAGEMIKITKEVDVNSKEAKAEIKKKEQEGASSTAKPTAGPSLASLGVKKSAGGLGSVLGKIGKKTKMSTLEKSKLDWDSFKTAEGIQDDLANHNKGKDGYIERQKFLERSDLRQFEIEKNMRLSGKR